MKSSLASVLLGLAPLFACASPVGLDGTLGAEWNGVAAVHVLADPAAPTSNFGSPGNTNATGYDIYLRTDANYLYAALVTTTPGAAAPLFANLYFALVYGAGPTTDAIGFEVTNDRAFKPSSIPGPYFNDTAANLIQFATTQGTGNGASVIETAIDLSVFTSNALGVTGFGGLPPGTSPAGVDLFLSQSFGFSVAGGTANYGPTQLGLVLLPDAATVPEPSGLALAALGLGGLYWTRRRAHSRAHSRAHE